MRKPWNKCGTRSYFCYPVTNNVPELDGIIIPPYVNVLSQPLHGVIWDFKLLVDQLSVTCLCVVSSKPFPLSKRLLLVVDLSIRAYQLIFMFCSQAAAHVH